MSGELQDFETFLKEREKVGSAYVNGDAGPLGKIVTEESPATFFGPGGGIVKGAKTVSTRYTKDAESFDKGGESHFEILQMGASDGVGYWTGFQIASAKMKGKAEPIPMKLRVTEVFRREHDNWKLVHRHADMLAEESKEK